MDFRTRHNDINAEKVESALKSDSRNAVSFLKDGKEQTFFIEANPQFKSINIYDEHLKKITVASALDNKTAEPAQLAKKNYMRQVIRGKGIGLIFCRLYGTNLEPFFDGFEAAGKLVNI